MLLFPNNLLLNEGTSPGGLNYDKTSRVVVLNMEDGSEQRVLVNKEPVDREQVTIYSTQKNINLLCNFYNKVERTNPFWFPSQLYGETVLARFAKGSIEQLLSISGDRQTQTATFSVVIDGTRKLDIPESRLDIVDVQETFVFVLRNGNILYDQYTTNNTDTEEIDFRVRTPLLFSFEDSSDSDTPGFKHREYRNDFTSTRFAFRQVLAIRDLDGSNNYSGQNLTVAALSRELTSEEISNLQLATI